MVKLQDHKTDHVELTNFYYERTLYIEKINQVFVSDFPVQDKGGRVKLWDRETDHENPRNLYYERRLYIEKINQVFGGDFPVQGVEVESDCH